MTATHSQPSSAPDEDRRRKIAYLATLCREQPDVYARVIRFADYAQSQGFTHDEGVREALRREGLLATE